MAVNIKDLYGNPGYRFKKYSQKFSIKNALPYLHGVFLLALKDWKVGNERNR